MSIGRSRSARLWAVIVALLLPLLATGCGDLSRDELNRGVESLSALAAQGGLIAGGVAQDETKSTYTRVMATTLGGEAQHEAEKLADAESSPEVRLERNRAVQIASELADLFSELQTYPGDEHHGAQVQRQMVKAKEQADALVERLTGEPR